MACSKDVASVIGMLCVSRKFRKDFFEKPQAKAEHMVGKLQPEDLQHVLNLAGQGKLPAGLTRDAYVSRLKTALDQVYAAADCPTPPCPPDPDPEP
jgi:hypothetical protein